MIIDVLDVDGHILRYISEHIPRIGETITYLVRGKPKTWEVLHVDHCIRKGASKLEPSLDIITVTVTQGE